MTVKIRQDGTVRKRERKDSIPMAIYRKRMKLLIKFLRKWKILMKITSSRPPVECQKDSPADLETNPPARSVRVNVRCQRIKIQRMFFPFPEM